MEAFGGKQFGTRHQMLAGYQLKSRVALRGHNKPTTTKRIGILDAHRIPAVNQNPISLELIDYGLNVEFNVQSNAEKAH
jgi:hypothetical protein